MKTIKKRKMGKLGELLVNKKKITKEQLERALKLQKKSKKHRLGEVLIDQGFITLTELIEFLVEQVEMSIEGMITKSKAS